MNRENICLILGAGASRPYGYPVASQLKERAIQYCLSKPVDCAPKDLLSKTHALLEKFALRFDSDESRSIDAFLARLATGNAEDIELSRHGRMAIAAVLSTYERSFDSERGWYGDVVQFLDADDESRALRVISFNYDRSLEQFLFQYFSTHLGTAEAARKFSRVIKIAHVYGLMAELPHLARNAALAVEYGGFTGHGKWKAGLERLRLVGDVNIDPDVIRKCNNWTETADAIVILGFGFDQTNLSRVGLHKLSRQFVFSTGFHLPAEDRSRVRWSCAPAKLHFGAEQADVKSFLETSAVLSVRMRSESAEAAYCRLGPGTP